MKKILLAWMGSADLRASDGNQEVGLGPIYAVVKERSYDQIELLSNYPKDKSQRYVKWLGNQTATPIAFHPVTLSSPTHFGEIYEAVVRLIQKLQSKWEADLKLTFHLSPGTPAMGAVWIILAKTRFPAELVESSPQAGVQTASVPFDISAEYIPDLLRRPDSELQRLSVGAPPEMAAFPDIIHQSKEMKKILSLARKVAIRKVPVLIEGESGTGKELLARAIHNASTRQSKSFIAVNCGAIPHELIESELFGHKKGAFTGATENRQGHFVKAHGGTIFLDEIGELPLPAQVKLLRVLQEQEVTPLGSSKPEKIDVRIISATNRTLMQEVAQKTFREDLFYRLAVFVLQLPSLRERQGDVGMLTDAMLDRLNKENAEDLGLEQKKLSPSARNLLLNHAWPGNIRELQNTLLRAAVISTGPKITEEEMKGALLPAPSSPGQHILDQPLGATFDLQKVMSEVATHYLQRAMAEAHGNKTEAAKLVGLPSYQTLTNWLKKYGINEGA